MTALVDISAVLAVPMLEAVQCLWPRGWNGRPGPSRVYWHQTAWSFCLRRPRRGLFDRAVSDEAHVTGNHFPFPVVGTIVPDDVGYTFVPTA